MAKAKPKSIADIARLAGVSKTTVSRALNDSPFINVETKKRVQSIIKAHAFQPSAMARNLSRRRSCTVGFVTHAYAKDGCGGITDPFSVEIMGSIAAGLHKLGYDLLTIIVDHHNSEWPAQFLDSSRVDGFIIMTSTGKRHDVELLLDRGAPFVAWGMGNGEYCTVCGDDVGGGRLATERLLSLGRERIGFIGGPKVESEVQGRYRGFEAALRAAGKEPDPALVVYGDYSEESGARGMAELLKRAPGLDAVFCNSDLMAIAAMRTLAAAGRQVPRDVAVVGYDNVSVSSYVTPSLTTVSQNIPLAGKFLAEDFVGCLVQRTVTNRIVPVELVVRASA